MLVSHTPLLTTAPSATRFCKHAEPPETDAEEDTRASETGAGHPHVGSHTTLSSDRPKGLVPLQTPGHHGAAPPHGEAAKGVCFPPVKYSSQSI